MSTLTSITNTSFTDFKKWINDNCECGSSSPGSLKDKADFLVGEYNKTIGINVLANADPGIDKLVSVTINGNKTLISAVDTNIAINEGVFKFSPDGSMTFTPKTDYYGDIPEVSYEVSGNQMDTSTLTITDIPQPPVTDIKGVITLSKNNIVLGESITATLTDPDGISGTVEWADNGSWTTTNGTTITYTPSSPATFTLYAKYTDDKGNVYNFGVDGVQSELLTVTAPAYTLTATLNTSATLTPNAVISNGAIQTKTLTQILNDGVSPAPTQADITNAVTVTGSPGPFTFTSVAKKYTVSGGTWSLDPYNGPDKVYVETIDGKCKIIVPVIPDVTVDNYSAKASTQLEITVTDTITGDTGKLTIAISHQFTTVFVATEIPPLPTTFSKSAPISIPAGNYYGGSGIIEYNAGHTNGLYTDPSNGSTYADYVPLLLNAADMDPNHDYINNTSPKFIYDLNNTIDKFFTFTTDTSSHIANESVTINVKPTAPNGSYGMVLLVKDKAVGWSYLHQTNYTITITD